MKVKENNVLQITYFCGISHITGVPVMYWQNFNNRHFDIGCI